MIEPKQQRILSIDAFRGITILVMVFVNELAGTRDIPRWMEHMKANEDAMSFVDVVFPAFLFIVGMSIPFALANRTRKGDSFLQLQFHILWRTLGLLVLGVFMVNGEEGVNAAATGIPGSLWSLLFYISAILVWNVYTFRNKRWGYILRGAGIAGLIVLGIIYRGGEDGGSRLQPHWWGILGLIGWAYLYACIFFQLLRGNIILLLLATALCTAFYMIAHTPRLVEGNHLNWMSAQAGNAAHTSVVLCGIILSRIFFGDAPATGIRNRFLQALLFAAILFIAGYFIRPYFKISKIYATPTWCLYSAGICCVVFGFLYWLIDIKKVSGWTGFFRPAGTNPLLTYIIPDILFALFMLFHFTILPNSLRYGLPGVLWAMIYAVAVMYIAKGLNALKIRLQL